MRTTIHYKSGSHFGNDSNSKEYRIKVERGQFSPDMVRLSVEYTKPAAAIGQSSATVQELRLDFPERSARILAQALLAWVECKPEEPFSVLVSE